jgi:archaemetzincin
MAQPGAGRTRVVLVTLGHVDEALVPGLAEGLERVAGMDVERGGALELVAEDRSPRSGQYRSSLVLYRLPAAPLDRFLLVLTEEDLHGGGLHFVFGHADPQSRRAVVSTARLKDQEDPSGATTARRLLVEALHELGHLAGLGHCPEPSCPMNPFFTLYELDQRSPAYCPRSVPAGSGT